ncbi:hypothetical protein JTE90_025318 [Oedothorax gibbosus]|uniref:Uncharacterized protein n=1 Tax=Oedothorax gibbosus TaxID=931172 RepID=A0AAV6V7I0_9ARAC|nr:hypothetical protein JTE90_025318 [Oedothorax gibbosus]
MPDTADDNGKKNFIDLTSINFNCRLSKLGSPKAKKNAHSCEPSLLSTINILERIPKNRLKRPFKRKQRS